MSLPLTVTVKKESNDQETPSIDDRDELFNVSCHLLYWVCMN